MGRFPSRKSPGKQPIKKRGIKRFLICDCGELGKQEPRTSHGAFDICLGGINFQFEVQNRAARRIAVITQKICGKVGRNL